MSSPKVRYTIVDYYVHCSVAAATTSCSFTFSVLLVSNGESGVDLVSIYPLLVIQVFVGDRVASSEIKTSLWCGFVSVDISTTG